MCVCVCVCVCVFLFWGCCVLLGIGKQISLEKREAVCRYTAVCCRTSGIETTNVRLSLQMCVDNAQMSTLSSVSHCAVT